MNKLLLLILLELTLINKGFANELVRILDLSGYWKFSIGDNPEKKEKAYRDAHWDEIKVPESWENQGYNGYDGIAWYRKSFDAKKLPKNRKIYLKLGYIDDADEVYLNGKLIGYSGKFPPNPKTSYRALREYFVPQQYIDWEGTNIIAVRVYDHFYDGGFTSGDIGLYYEDAVKSLNIELEGIWKFRTGSNSKWYESDYNDSQWEPILAPMFWDLQGYKHFNGKACYRKTVFISKELAKQNLTLILGKIDDFDEVYFNGELIGSTNDGEGFGNSYSYLQERRYKIPPSLVKKDDYNTIAIRVIDIGYNGGMYEGPLGINVN
ncbi:MAG: glycoside hydrolase [Thalassobius sp.]|nr:glycoside hydrolase [Thalassovita sp.]